MTIEDILKLPADQAYIKLKEKASPEVTAEDVANQYNPYKHAVMDTVKRPLKTVKKTNRAKDDKGNETYNTTLEDVNRIAVPYQRIIVSRSVGFLLGNPVKLQSGTDDQSEIEVKAMIEKIWEDNKLDYKNKEIARTLFSECEVAELWYLTEDDTFWEKDLSTLKPKMKVLKPSEGDKLYPRYDDKGDMIAFSREYTVTVDEKSVTRMETYTATTIYKFEKTDSGVVMTSETNYAGKIPVIYYKQDYPEWHFVQTLIERLETLLSNFGDTNDYFGSPMILVNGKIKGMASKGQQGKILEMDAEGKAQYLSWDQAPESVKLEKEALEELIYSCTQTPNISFSQMKGLGNLTGIALKMMFLDAHMKAEDKIEVFGEMIQRRLNLLKSICINAVDISLKESGKGLSIVPVFKPYLPRNEKEDLEMLTTATGGKAVISQATAIENNPLVNDSVAELDRIKEETAEAAKLVTNGWGE